jgi:hypothetical protein
MNNILKYYFSHKSITSPPNPTLITLFALLFYPALIAIEMLKSTTTTLADLFEFLLTQKKL